jgi:hypothetical protein
MSGILRQPSRSNTVPLGEWFPLSGPGMLFLALCPPRDAHRGIVEVHVEQKSTGQTAVVEFELDARAAGPRCLIAE